MTERQEILMRMKRMEDYFKKMSVDESFFQPEFECAEKIRQIAEAVERLTVEDAAGIVKLFNNTNTGQHYSGSGWMDFKPNAFI